MGLITASDDGLLPMSYRNMRNQTKFKGIIFYRALDFPSGAISYQ
jgi:hypothetical protein